MPKVSVILTSFNQEQYLAQAIQSVLNQTFQDFELIIYDDCSTDGSWEVICSYDDPRIRCFRSQVNERGLVNKGLLEVRGELVAIHHSDDIWDVRKLERQVELMESKADLGAIFTWVRFIDEDGEDLENAWFNVPNRSRENWLLNLFQVENRFCHPSALVRKSVYDTVGIYQKEFFQLPDAEMWVRILSKYEVHVIEEPLTFHRAYRDKRNSSGNRSDVRVRIGNEIFHFMNSFKTIDCQMLFKMFPDLPRGSNPIEQDFDFLLALAAALYGNMMMTKAWGIQSLYFLFHQPERATIIERLYGFNYWSLVKLSGELDVFSVILNEGMQVSLKDCEAKILDREKEIEDLRNQLVKVQHQKDEVENLRKLVGNIYSSRSWRYTRILRGVSKCFRKVIDYW